MIHQAMRLAGAILVAAVVACDGDQRGGTSDTGTGMPTIEAVPGMGGSMNDSNVVAAMIASNAAEIQAGQLAADSGTNARVKEFGRLMVTDHRAMNEQVHQAARQANVVSRPGDQAEDIGEDGREMMEELRGKRGAEFDREYMDEMVDSHEEALEMLDRAARDTARAAPIREAVTQSRQKVQQHLDQARRLQQQLKQGS